MGLATLINTVLLKQKIWLVLLAIATVTGCSPSEFSDSYPYAVRIAKVRYKAEVDALMPRLEANGIEAYALPLQAEDGSFWYEILTAAEPALETVMAQRIALEDENRLRNAELVNFNSMRKALLAAETQQVPDLPKAEFQKDLVRLTENYKLLPGFILKHMKLYRTGNISKNNLPDLPRGLGLQQLHKLGTSLTEARWYDPLRKWSYTVHYLNLQAEAPRDLTFSLANEILNTRNYSFEESEEVSFGDLKGYRVTLAPRPKEYKHYLILADTDFKQLFLLQTDAGIAEPLNEVAVLLSGGESLLQYPPLQALAAHVPGMLLAGDSLQMVQFNLNSWSEAPSPAANEGLGTISLTFENPLKGRWQLNVSYRPGLEPVTTDSTLLLYNQLPVKALLSKKRNPLTGHREQLPEQLSWQQKGYQLVIESPTATWLTEAELMERANATAILPEQAGFF